MSKNTQVEAPMQKKNVGYRIFAALFLLACVAVLFLPIKTFVSAWVLNEQTLLETFKAMFASDVKLFGVLPALISGNGDLVLVANLAIYLFALRLLLTIIFAFFAIVSRKAAPRRLRLAVLFYMYACAGYAAFVLYVSTYSGTKAFDLITLALAALGAIAYFVLMIIKLGKGALISALHYVLTLAFTALLVGALVRDGKATDAVFAANATYKTVLVGIVALALVNLFIGAIRAMCARGFAFDVVRYILQIFVALVACYVCYAGELNVQSFVLVVGAAGVALIQIIVTILHLNGRARKKTNEAREEVLSGFEREAYVEAYTYEGGPVEGVVLAEEVTPTMAAANGTQPDLPSLIGNGFDPFMSTLSMEEKSEFIDLYILRCKGLMPEIPGYVVGDVNKEFFNSIFIYLGQYRDKISSGLLQKIYDYSMKL